ncbi:BRO-N domain-containing protein [Aquitalea aquatica]|uniref:Bro-N domain-containing protein n=1 Tax=Aquitalea aquatica TaxID=3044273 RepID=A0A838XYR5_9NEIS|nr:BRO family protein [Aquitalea magnusonii]MBA4707526.1 hypothetical protein [Aquitalea magnusonii]
MSSTSLVFQNTQFDVIDQDGQPWLKAADIARALGYAREDSVSRIYYRNSDEFTGAMSGAVKLTGPGNLGEITVRIFSLRGAHLLAMFARTAVAKAFRKWVLDILDSVAKTGGYRPEATREVHLLGLSKDHQDAVKAHHKAIVSAAPADKRAKLSITLWSSVKSKFGCSYKDVPDSDFINVVSLMSRVAIEGEWMPAQKELPQKQTGYLLTEQEAAALSGVFSKAERAADLLRRLEAPLRMMKSPLAAGAFDSGHEIWPFLSNTKKVREYCRQTYLSMERRVLG